MLLFLHILIRDSGLLWSALIARHTEASFLHQFIEDLLRLGLKLQNHLFTDTYLHLSAPNRDNTQLKKDV